MSAMIGATPLPGRRRGELHKELLGGGLGTLAPTALLCPPYPVATVPLLLEVHAKVFGWTLNILPPCRQFETRGSGYLVTGLQILEAWSAPCVPNMAEYILWSLGACLPTITVVTRKRAAPHQW